MRVRVVLGVFAALALLAGVGIYVAARGLRSGLPLHLAVQQCEVNANGTAVLDPDQMANAATIAAVGIRRGLPAQAIAVALATALQESKLENLAGGDRDSVGLFQQRPSQGWGTPDQISDPRYAAQKFYSALVKVKNWQQMRIADAAQAVQRSADGEAYQRWADEATVLATALIGDTGGAVACTVTDQPAQRGAAAIQALTQSVTADWGKVGTSSANGVLGIQLTASATRVGWQYAHWLVSHSVDQNVKSVRYGGQIWTAKSGSWSHADASGPGAGDHVVAEVYS